MPHFGVDLNAQLRLPVRDPCQAGIPHPCTTGIDVHPCPAGIAKNYCRCVNIPVGQGSSHSESLSGGDGANPCLAGMGRIPVWRGWGESLSGGDGMNPYICMAGIMRGWGESGGTVLLLVVFFVFCVSDNLIV